MLDRTLRNNISLSLVRKYPIINLIWKDGNFKSYSELMADKKALLQGITYDAPFDTIESQSYTTQTTTKKEKVERLYNAIIQSDPMLYIESLL